MKILYRGSYIHQCIQFVILNILSLFIESSILLERKIFIKKNLFVFLNEYKYFCILALVTIILLSRVSKYSFYSFFMQGVYFLSIHLVILYTNFNKLTLVFSCLFFVLYFYFLTLLKGKLESAYIKPFFLKNYVGGKPELELKALIQAQGRKIEGTLANWDEYGCYVYLNDPFDVADRSVWVDFPFEDTHFQDRARIARLSRDRKEIGLRIYSTKDLSDEKKFKWKSYIKILEDRGFMPKRWK